MADVEQVKRAVDVHDARAQRRALARRKLRGGGGGGGVRGGVRARR